MYALKSLKVLDAERPERSSLINRSPEQSYTTMPDRKGSRSGWTRKEVEFRGSCSCKCSDFFISRQFLVMRKLRAGHVLREIQ